MPRFALVGDWEKVGELRRRAALPDSWNSTLPHDRNHETLTRHFSHSIHAYLGSLIALYPICPKVFCRWPYDLDSKLAKVGKGSHLRRHAAFVWLIASMIYGERPVRFRGRFHVEYRHTEARTGVFFPHGKETLYDQPPPLRPETMRGLPEASTPRLPWWQGCNSTCLARSKMAPCASSTLLQPSPCTGLMCAAPLEGQKNPPVGSTVRAIWSWPPTRWGGFSPHPWRRTLRLAAPESRSVAEAVRCRLSRSLCHPAALPAVSVGPCSGQIVPSISSFMYLSKSSVPSITIRNCWSSGNLRATA